jgi:biopolymer transport protein TolQ
MAPAELDLIGMVRSSGLIVQLVLFMLIFFSIASWGIIIVKYRYLRKALKESAVFTDFFWKSRDLAEAFARARQLQFSPIARVFRSGYQELRKVSKAGAAAAGHENGSLYATLGGSENVKRALRRAITAEIVKMTQMVPFLATTGNTTPFIGLFGTVWGIMNSFHGIGLKGSASLAVVAPGISEALVATATGLAAAIPAVIAFNYFMNKIRIIESDLQNFSADFLNIIERDILRDDGGR